MNILCKRYLENMEYKIDKHIDSFCDSSNCDTPINEIIFESLWSLLNLRGIRRRNYLSEQDKEYIEQKLKIYVLNQIQTNETINFFFFDIPIKTGKNKTSPDIGEYIMFAKLNTIAEKFKRIYPKGLRFNIISDGFLFVESGFINKLDYKSYLNKCNDLIYSNNFENVSVMDGKVFIQEFEINTILSLPDLFLDKIKLRLLDLNKNAFSEESFVSHLNARNSLEVNKKKFIKNLVHEKFGFYITKVGFKKDTPVLSFYPFATEISESPSRGKTYFYNKKGKLSVGLLKG
jgi:hypothetical protein